MPRSYTKKSPLPAATVTPHGRRIGAGEDVTLSPELDAKISRMTTQADADIDTLKGVGPDAPVVTGVHGGLQSFMPYRFDLVDARALFALAEILDYGTRKRGYPEQNWRKIPAVENINHALMHLYAHLEGDTQDKHLAHAFCRIMFALGVELQGGPIRD